MKQNLQLIILIFIFQSCATFKSSSNKISTLEKSNLELLNGRYEISSIEHLDKFKSFDYHNFLREIDRKILKDTLNIDSTKFNQVELKVLDRRRLEIKYLEDDKVIRRRTIKTKLKKDGYLYLKNKNIGFSLVPYLFGGLDVKRTRITINENDDLVLDVSHFQGGAAFLIIFLDAGTYRYKKTYKKIK